MVAPMVQMPERSVARNLRRFLLLASALWLLPLLLAAIAAFESPELARRQPGLFWPEQPTLLSYRALFESDFARWSWNSIVAATVGTSLALFAAIPLGFAAGYRAYKIPRVLIRLLLLVYLVPPVFLVFPILSWSIALSLRGSTVVVGVLSASLSLPVCAWILEAQFAMVPVQLFETAELDGLSIGRRLVHVIGPSAGRGIVAAGSFALIVAWGEYVFSIALLPQRSQYTLSTGIPHFLQGDIWAWELLLPAIVITAVPPVIGGVVAAMLVSRSLGLSSPEARNHA